MRDDHSSVARRGRKHERGNPGQKAASRYQTGNYRFKSSNQVSCKRKARRRRLHDYVVYIAWSRVYAWLPVHVYIVREDNIVHGPSTVSTCKRQSSFPISRFGRSGNGHEDTGRHELCTPCTLISGLFDRSWVIVNYV